MQDDPNPAQVQGSNLQSANGNMISPASHLNPISPLNSLSTKPHIKDSNLPIAIRKGTRKCMKRLLYPLSHYVSLNHFSPCHKNFIVSLNTLSIPNTLSKALTKYEWRNAMREEIGALEKNKTWEIVERPKGKNLLGCIWVFTLKCKADGSLERNKARLGAKGYTKTYGIDYQKTFVLVAKTNMRLGGRIYMSIPLGFEGKETANKLCRLRKALYGLKQTPRAWLEGFSKEDSILDVTSKCDD